MLNSGKSGHLVLFLISGESLSSWSMMLAVHCSFWWWTTPRALSQWEWGILSALLLNKCMLVFWGCHSKLLYTQKRINNINLFLTVMWAGRTKIRSEAYGGLTSWFIDVHLHAVTFYMRTPGRETPWGLFYKDTFPSHEGLTFTT